MSAEATTETRIMTPPHVRMEWITTGAGEEKTGAGESDDTGAGDEEGVEGRTMSLTWSQTNFVSDEGCWERPASAGEIISRIE